MAVVYKYKWVLTRSGKFRKKKIRVSSDFEIKKFKPRRAPVDRWVELARKLWVQKQKLDKLEAERARRRKHEEYLKWYELNKKRKEVFECYCKKCRRVRVVKSPVFVIMDSGGTLVLGVKGRCVICSGNTLVKRLRKATEEEIKKFG